LSLVGAVIMPHNLYLHSSLVLTRKINSKNLDKVNEANIYNTIESAISLFISFLISSAVIITFGAYIIANPNANKDIDLESASVAL
jgi:natural resistance-associated macrophage protein